MSYEIHLATLQRQPAAVVSASVKQEDIAEFLGSAFEEVMTAVRQQGLSPAGPPFGRYVVANGEFQVEAGFPVSRPVKATGRLLSDDLPGGTVAYTVHTGPYDGIGAAYAAATAWLTDNGLVASGLPWERYLDDPEVSQPRTEVFVPCRPMAPSEP